jgi:DNA polymerase (family 10)
MDNRAIANIFYETADLMEVANEDPFRIRSYRRAAEALEGYPTQIRDIIGDEKAVLAIPGIGKGMLLNLKEVLSSGELKLHRQFIKKYQPGMLELLKISGLGPKTVALIWDAYQVADLAGVEKLAREGKLRELPRLSAKSEEKILKGIEDYRRITGRYHLDEADTTAQKIIGHLSGLKGVEKITPAGSLRRGRETVGDLDILVTGKGCCVGAPEREAIIERIVNFPGIAEVIAKGDNKISFRMRNGMQVDVRLLPPESFGAAMQYFTGSKNHNVSLRQRALKMGLTLNEYGLAEVEGGKIVAGQTEEEVYKKLKLAYVPPELRENCGEIEAAANGHLPELVELKDIQGDVHMHTVETDGKCTIEEMAEAARDRGYKYMAITDHSKNLAFANGLDDKRAEQHIKRIRAVAKKMSGIKIFAGIEVDILADGDLDLSDDVLAQMDIVIGSVHSHFNQEPKKMTDRLLRALENKHISLIGHPTGRILLRRDAYALDMDAVLKAAAKAGVAMEHNAYPDRLDLNDVHLRIAKERSVKIIINTDAHHTSHMEKMKYGVLQLRRAWLTKNDVLNTLPHDQFAKAVKRGA